MAYWEWYHFRIQLVQNHLVHISFYTNYITFTNNKLSYCRDLFSVLFLGKLQNTRKYRFWLQKRIEIKKQYHIWKFGGWLYNDSTLIFEVKSLWKDLVPKVHFSLAFMHKSCKNTKYIFWLQKVVKSWIWWHFQIRDQKLVYISFLLFLQHERFIPLVGGVRVKEFR